MILPPARVHALVTLGLVLLRIGRMTQPSNSPLPLRIFLCSYDYRQETNPTSRCYSGRLRSSHQGTEEQQSNTNGVDIDDAQLEEPKDDAFKKPAWPEEEAKRRRKKA